MPPSKGRKNMPSEIKRFVDFITRAMDSPVWQDDAVFKLYLYCLSKASHNSCTWRGIQIEPGDLPASERHMAEALRWSRCKVQRKMGELCKIGLISKSSISAKGTMIHITGWPHKKTGDPETGLTADPHCTDDESSPHGDLPENWLRYDTGPCPDGPETSPVLSHSESSFSVNGPTVSPNPIKNICSSSGLSGFEPEGFKEIWVSYPAIRRNNRSEAAALVARAMEEGATAEAILEALENDKRSVTWCQENGRFIPGIVKWLQKETWRNCQPPEEPREDDEHWISR